MQHTLLVHGTKIPPVLVPLFWNKEPETTRNLWHLLPSKYFHLKSGASGHHKQMITQPVQILQPSPHHSTCVSNGYCYQSKE